MSRIPKVGFGSSIGVKDKENKIDVTSKKSNNLGFKRPSNDNLPLMEKKPRLNFNSVVAKTKAISSVQPSTSQRNKFIADQKSKRALQPIPDPDPIRCSMPAVTSTGNFKIPGKPKRPAWDLKGRIQDMEENFRAANMYKSTLEDQLQMCNQRIAALETTNSVLHKDFEAKSIQSEEATSQIQKLQSQLKEKTEEYEKENQKLKLLEQERTNLKANYENLQNLYHEEISVLKSQITSLTSMKSGVQAQLDAAELLVENLRGQIKQLEYACKEKDSTIEFQSRQIADMDSKIRYEETIRRKLHNTIQELKGNIRVFCRLRPPLPDEVKNGMIPASIVPVSEKTIEIQQLPEVGLNESGGKSQPKYEFSFDCFFSPSTQQEEVFSEISQLVQSALDGYNVCIFAYGQTGSGKTFTMEGPAEIVDFVSNRNNPQLGMIPRSVHQIFSTITDLVPKGWKYTVQTLFLEIYNERIQDLLSTQGTNTKCEIVKSGSKGNDCVLSNVTAVDVSSEEEVYELMKKARINRAVASTKCNEHSSRSHFVFQMKIHGENSITSEKCDATLSLVDLAGSERIKDSESSGDRLTEAKAINKSLSNLGNVIMSLSKKESHIPYRDSKLTHLLSTSLGGNSKTLMFVNISPDNKNLNETINSLRFATKVNQCVIGTAQKRVK